MNILSQVKIILGLESKGFPAARQQIKGFVEGTQRELSQLKTFVGGFFTVQFAGQLVHSVAQMVGRFKDLNETSSEGLDTIQKYDQVFKKFGGTAEDAIKIWDELALARKEALEKGGEAGIKLQRLGLTPQEIQSLETGRQLYERIAQISNDPNNAEQRTAFLDLFGKKKGGMALAGAAALAEGGEFSIISDEQIRALDDAAKSFEKAALEFKIASVPLVTALANFWSNIPEWFNRLTGGNNTPKQRQLSILNNAREMRGTLGLQIGTPYSDEEWKRITDIQKRARLRNTMSEKEMALAERQLLEIKTGQKIPLTGEQKVRNFANKTGNDFFNAPNESDVKAFAEKLGIHWDEGTVKAAEKKGFSKLPADIRNDRAALGNAFDSVFFRAGNTEDKKKQLLEQMLRDEADAKSFEEQGKFDEARKLRAGNIKSAGDLAEMERTPHQEFRSDQLAQVGGLIGGAATIDPSLTVQQSQLQVLTAILNEFPSLRTALEQRNQPIQQLQ